MHTRESHRCQVDCSDPNEVISALELKSKDLYLFWRNYEWLYNRYSQQPLLKSQPHAQCTAHISTLEAKITSLQRQSTQFKIEAETLRRQLQSLQTSPMEGDYRRELELVRNQCKEEQLLREKLSGDNLRLKKEFNELQANWQAERSHLLEENKRTAANVVTLQKNIDQIRQKTSMGHQGYQDTTKGEIQEWRTKVERNEREIQRKNGEIQLKDGEIQELRKRVERIEMEIQRKDGEIKQLRNTQHYATGAVAHKMSQEEIRKQSIMIKDGLGRLQRECQIIMVEEREIMRKEMIEELVRFLQAFSLTETSSVIVYVENNF